MNAAEFSLCEAIQAAPKLQWHIRRLTHLGKKLQEGADTAALCGAHPHHDLNAEITYYNLQHCCPQCARVYMEMTQP